MLEINYLKKEKKQRNLLMENIEVYIQKKLLY